VDPGAGVDAVAKRKILCPCQKSNPRYPIHYISNSQSNSGLEQKIKGNLGKVHSYSVGEEITSFYGP
jgi:hypothetical protein